MELILSKYIGPGTRLQLQKIVRSKTDEKKVIKTYDSRVLDILSDERIEVSMPFEKTKLVLLSIDEEYNLFFYTTNGLYQCSARVAERYKNNKVYSVIFELTSNLRKFQRRDYYRFSCALEMKTRALQEDEIKAVEKNEQPSDREQPLQKCVIVDISGGGLRFVSPYVYEVNSMILCKYSLWIDGENKEFTLVGKVLSVKQSEKRPDVYEHRLQYVNMEDEKREEIIKYIFDAERTTIQKQRYGINSNVEEKR